MRRPQMRPQQWASRPSPEPQAPSSKFTEAVLHNANCRDENKMRLIIVFIDPCLTPKLTLANGVSHAGMANVSGKDDFQKDLQTSHGGRGFCCDSPQPVCDHWIDTIDQK